MGTKFRTEGGGRVYAFEPQRLLCSYLRRSILENRLSDYVAVEEFAVGAHDGIVDLSGATSDRSTFAITSLPATGGQISEERDVPVKALDGLDRDWGEIGMIKIDVEGAEPMFLEGARERIHRHKPSIVSEVSDRMTMRTSSVRAIDYIRDIANLGYEVRSLRAGGRLGAPKDLGELALRDVQNLVFWPIGR